MNEFMQDFAAANDELADAKQQLSDANSRARKCRQKVKDAQARVDKLRSYAESFGVDLDGDGGDNDDSTESSSQSRADDNGDAVTDGYAHQSYE